MAEKQVLDFVANVLNVLRQKEVQSFLLLLDLHTCFQELIGGVLRSDGGVWVELLLVPFYFLFLCDRVNVVLVVNPAVLSDLAISIEVVDFILETLILVTFKWIEAFLLLGLPNVGYCQVLLHGHHHVDHLLLEV